MAFDVLIPKSVLKSLNKITDNDKSKVIFKLKDLTKASNPLGSIKLKGYENQFRIRVGDYRIRYLVNSKSNEIVILDFAHRKEVYKKK